MNKTSVVLIGMSNVGKSTLAPKLEDLGFTRICCDDEIEKRLGPQLLELGYKGINDVAKWMGFPFDERYPVNSATYLRHEVDVMTKVIERLFVGERLVVDTTGSVIYTGESILRIIRMLSTVILLDATEGLQDELYRKYMVEPKPVLWGDDAYAPLVGEHPMVALGRCYPNLLKTRNVRYRKLAHVAINHLDVRAEGYTLEDFLKKAGVRL